MKPISLDMPEPTWRKCTRCGAETMGVMCFECVGKREAADKAREARAALERTIPKDYGIARFDTGALRDSESLTLARRNVDTRSVMLWGATSAGKTTLGVAMLRAWAQRNAPKVPIFVHAIMLATARIQHAAGDGEASIVLDAMNAPLVLIDDVGKDLGYGRGNALPSVVLFRAAMGLPTWITTEMSPNELVTAYRDTAGDNGMGVGRRLCAAPAVVIEVRHG